MVLVFVGAVITRLRRGEEVTIAGAAGLRCRLRIPGRLGSRET